MKAEMVETEINEVRAMELEAHIFEAGRTRARQSRRDTAIEADLAEAEERERRSEIKRGKHVWLLA